MLSELEEINNKLTKVCASVEHIKEHVTEMKTERDKHKGEFWTNMNAMKDSLRDEQEARKLEDQSIRGDLGKMKIKVGAIVTGVTVALTAGINWAWRQVK